jgi:hypothetical protein
MLESQYRRDLGLVETDITNGIEAVYVERTINRLCLDDPKAFTILNANALFWSVQIRCLHTTIFMTLGRIFDHQAHSIQKVLAATVENPQLFSKEAIAFRKLVGGKRPGWLDDYLKDLWVHNPDDLQPLMDETERFRKIYEAVYRPIRSKVYAHRVLKEDAQVASLFGKTNVTVLEEMFRFLYKLARSLAFTLDNGKKPCPDEWEFGGRETIEEATRRALLGS